MSFPEKNKMITVRENEHDIDSISRNHECISRIAFQKRQVSLLNIQIEIVIIIHSYYKNKNRFFDFFSLWNVPVFLFTHYSVKGLAIQLIIYMTNLNVYYYYYY